MEKELRTKIEFPNAEAYIETPHTNCSICEHILTVGDYDDEAGWTCRAFPNGIPWDLVFAEGQASHDEEYPGDNGYRFKSPVIEHEGHRFATNHIGDRFFLID